MCDSAVVLGRLQDALGVNTDTDLASVLGVKRATLGAWRSRNSTPYAECIKIAKCKNISLDWLLTGKEPVSSNVITGNGNVANNNSAGASINIAIAETEPLDHNKEVNNLEDELLETFRMINSKQQQYIFHKMKTFALENEFQQS